MANHKSCEKRARQTKIKTERNRFYKTRIKNVTKNVLAAIEGADKEKAVEAMKAANKYLHHCVSKGILKKGTAARRVGRLQVKVNAI
ncbi:MULTISPECIES: 30S ribosomal protein S20 [Arcobacter]|jgi:small subunit ribosomal protein S20|uniref:Small ribosomal subunit protein bS20 n=1 Tax=Arcobacter ellisii TaxID=913109 RepID=A0A347U503_9BACT|nr:MULTISPECIES: 30S ribosomal protein S20 [Arcobacter]AXX93931.1 30S ribosomal protein S20 [Arcobacter ellisii]MDD3008667.1 30S ribosomal protein S20 [Arcobacter sp.]MDY3203548.1 30S ribosomal protein S20 [Arcobacter sp.]RXI33123.1 30S ribosomal protein S20 [Arcobacter ellisii]